MKLYHSTSKGNADSIMREGLRPNEIGIVYLSPSLKEARGWGGEVILEVETGDCKLTAFEDCKAWEVLCWPETPIPPTQIKVIETHLKTRRYMADGNGA